MRALSLSSLALMLLLPGSVLLAQSVPVEEAPLPEKIQTPPRPEDAPTVNIRTLESGDVVEEYRQNGRLYEVRVRPRNGVPYALLDINGDGRLDRRDTEGPVAPVYYTLYEWD